MREISSFSSHTSEEFLQVVPPAAAVLVERIRAQKKLGTRPLPSSTLLDQSGLLLPTQRSNLLDRVAMLVDENLFGRSEMCEQFSSLLTKALRELELPAQIASGDCSYYRNGVLAFTWQHYWVRVGSEVIDANGDCLAENPAVPTGITPRPYWGAIQDTPTDRRLRGQCLERIPYDVDVETIWWPELKKWVNSPKFAPNNSFKPKPLRGSA